MAYLKRDKTGQSGKLSRLETGQNGTALFRGVPMCPASSREGEEKAARQKRVMKMPKLSADARRSMLMLGLKP